MQHGKSRCILKIGVRIELREIQGRIYVAPLACVQTVLAGSYVRIRIADRQNIVRCVAIGTLRGGFVAVIGELHVHMPRVPRIDLGVTVAAAVVDRQPERGQIGRQRLVPSMAIGTRRLAVQPAAGSRIRFDRNGAASQAMHTFRQSICQTFMAF
jgi:hypothetical protein